MEEPRRPSDFAPFKDTDQLGDRQLGVLVGRAQVSGELRLGPADCVQDGSKLVVHRFHGL
jgi:hypothetical protein